MIDFTKKIHNSNKFRQPALEFLKTGQYCQYPKGTTEYMAYWTTEQDRCINGYTAEDGDFISGYNYFYLNYCPILRIVNKKVNGKVKSVSEVTFPDFWDYDYYYFQTVEEAQLQGKHLCVLKSRRKGYSYKAASMMCRNYYLIPNTSSYVYASNKQYLTDDGVLTKAWNYMDFIDEHTAWGKKRSVKTQLRRRAGMWVKDEYDNQIEVGYKSEIIGVTLKDNPDVGHPYDQIVYTPEGKKKWEDITVGSKLFDSRGDITTVTEVNELGKVPVYKLTLSDGRTVEATADHKWRVFRYRHKQHSWNGKNEKREIREIELTTEEIFNLTKNKSYKTNRCRIKTRFSVPFNNQEVPIDAYTMGFLLGDGSLTKTSNHKAYFVQSTEDYESIKHLFPYKVDKQHGITYAVNILNAKQIIKELNLLDKTSDNKFIPDCYKYNSEEIRLAILNGLLDTDGSVTKDYGVIEYVSKSYQLAQDVRWLLFSLGINNSLHVKYIKQIPYYRVYIYCSGKEDRLFCIPRKKERIAIKKLTPFALSKVQYVYIDKVERIEDKVSKCVTVDAEDHVYMIGDFIETKNCRGKRANLILFEEAGSFKELSAAWQIARPSVEIDGRAFATMIAYGTGGDEESNFFTLKDMFYHPEGYNCLPLPNIWDENVANTECGFFIPQYTNMDLRDEQGKRLYMDEDGNTLTSPAKQYILEERRKVIEHSTSSVAVDRYVAERPCLDKDTWISTEDGTCRIKDNPKAWITGVKDIYKVTTEDGAELLCTKEHPIFNGTEYIELKDLKIGDKIKYHPTIFNTEYQKVSVPGLIPACDIDFTITEEWGKFIGLFMGDGFYYGPTGTIGIVFDKKDINTLEWCESFLTKTIGKPSRKIIGKNNGGITITVSRKGSIEFFKALDLVKTDKSGRLNRKVHVPDYIIKSPKSVVSAFLSGLFDSDGYAGKDGKHVGFFSKEKQVLLDMQFLLRGFDINASIRSRETINGNGFKYTENKLNIRISDIPKFREEISFISNRKNALITNTTSTRKHPDFTFTTITGIEYVKTEEVWDITTESHYLSANGIWVHNCTPAEACLEFNGNIFPKKELQEQLGKIRTNKLLQNRKQVGDLIWESNGSLKWLPKKSGDITHYPLNKNDDPTGSIVIWEHPVKDAPIGLYIIGVDPYDHDQSGTNSLGSCFVYKRFQNFENYYDLIVAEYTGRPSTAEEFYENVRKLAIYYNARIMYENQNKGLFPYFVAKHCDYLLADQPDILNDIIGNSKVNRKKGCHMTKQIKQWGEGLIKDWLNEEKAPGHKNLHDILSEPLLEELIAYNDIGNFDRVCSLIQVMIYREQLYNIVVKEKKKQNKSRLLFDGPIFNEDSWYDDTMNNVEEDVYTFN